MKITHLVVQEIVHRRLNFLLAVFGVSVAIACLVGAATMLNAGEFQTEQAVQESKQAAEKAVRKSKQAAEKAGKQLQDEMRKITKGLGFNIVVLAEDEDLGAFHAEGTPTKTMPQEYVTRLAKSPIVVINHLLPIVTRKIEWPETKQTIVLTGTRGEVPQAHRDPKKPLLDLVPPGKIVLGHHLHTSQNLKPGDTLTLKQRKFEVLKCHPERGSVDDVTAWLNLEEAQEMLGMQNLVNAILALECNCATVDRVAEIRGEIAKVLPGTKVLERGRKALARAEARNKAKKSADRAVAEAEASGAQLMADAEASGARLMADRQELTSVMVPVAMIGSFAWIALLALGNSRQRRSEIGILRAIGLGSRQVLVLFLGKALLVGLTGGAIGYAIGFLAGSRWGAAVDADLFQARWLITALLLAPLLSAAASWIPALLASRQDPAVVLQEQ